MMYLVNGKPSNVVGRIGDCAHDEAKKVIYMRDRKGWDAGTIYRETGLVDENIQLRAEVERLNFELSAAKGWRPYYLVVCAGVTVAFVSRVLRWFFCG